jgi:integrase
MHVEYGALESDYVFVNLWGGQARRPLRYTTVNDIVLATRRAVGFHFTAHFFRHTYATLSRRAGVPLDVLSQLITHRSVQTTQQIYTHLDVEDLREELRRAGVLGMVEDLV